MLGLRDARLLHPELSGESGWRVLQGQGPQPKQKAGWIIEQALRRAASLQGLQDHDHADPSFWPLPADYWP
jgi:hypothetical protein